MMLLRAVDNVGASLLWIHLFALLRTVVASRSLSSKTLQVMSVTPSVNSARASLRPPPEVMLSDRQAITVTFNRAFIALGSDYGAGPLPPSLIPLELEPAVPGHMRWVTTSVMRFDPSEDWPAELNLKLSLRAGITSYDGASVDEGQESEWRFRTPLLQMHMESVHSKRAKNLTAGRWIPGSVPEVPPDGILQLRFTGDVELELLRKHLQLRPGGGKHDDAGARVSFELGECRTGPSPRCVWLTPTDELQAEHEYELVLLKGSQFHAHAGLTHKQLAVPLQGLRGFSLQLKSTRPDETWFRPRYRRLRLWLRHGLQEGTDMMTLSRLFALTPSLAFNLTHPEPAVLQLEAELQPDTEYTLAITASGAVRDGFGLPLQSSKGTFRTAVLQSFFLEPGASDYFVKAAMFSPGVLSKAPMLARWPVIARGRTLCAGQVRDAELDCGGHPQHIDISSVRKEDIQKAIASMHNEHEDFLRHPSATIRLEAPLHDEATELHMPLFESMKTSGLALHTRWTRNSYQPKVSSLLGTPSLAAALVTTSDGMLTVWVLRAEDNAVVADATVTAFGQSCWDRCQPDDVKAVAVGVTDGNGVVNLHAGNSNLHLSAVAVVKEGEPLLLHTEVPQALHPPPNFFKGQLLVDRSVYKPLDDIMLKGYVRFQMSQQLVLPSSKSVHSLRVRWTSGGKTVTKLVSLDRDFGSFNANLTVPADAQFGNHFIELVQVDPPPHDYPKTISTVQVTVADPRPPTVSLTVNAEQPFLPPDGELPLTMSTATFSGVPMANASVKLTWKLQHQADHMWWAQLDEDTEQDETFEKEDTGSEDFRTGDNGSTTVLWRLPRSLSKKARIGDTVSLSFEWVGPTREILSQHLTVPVAHSEWTLELSVPNARDALPKQPLSVIATLQRRVDLEGTMQLVREAPLSISLYHIKDDKANAAIEVKDGAPELLPQRSARLQECKRQESRTNEGRLSCEIQLPAMGRYLVAACTRNEDNAQQLCSAVPVGRTEAEWKKTPLTEFLQQAISRVTPDKQRYRMGDVPKLEFHNPLHGLRAFVKWGNRLSFRSTVTSRLSVGPATIELDPLSEECDGGCQIWILLCAPSNSTREMPVPTSPLFDLHGPQSATQTLTLNVEAKESQELSVIIKPDSEVQVPGSRAGFTVTLKHANGSSADGEVTVFAVDQAFLELQPHEPVNLSQVFIPDSRGGQLDHTFSHRHLVSAHGLNFTADALMRLLHADPWLLDSGTEWPLRPAQGSLAQLSLEDMLRDHTFDLTEIPWVSAGPFQGNFIRSRGGPLFMMAKSAAPVAEMSLMAAPATADAEDANSEPMFRDDSAGGSSGGSQASKALPLRTNFIVTPLFLPTLHVYGGSAHVEWTLPDNIGSFELRAYAVSKAHEFGGGSTTQQVVRRPVSMSPSVPRIVRVGDTFRGGVTLTAALDASATRILHVKMHLHGAAVRLETGGRSPGLMVAELEKQVHVGAGQTQEVTFGMHAASLGNVTLVVSATGASGQVLDALRMELIVLGAQPEVQVATSFAVTASPPPALPWYEGLVLPASANGSGHLSVTAGVGRQPAVQNLATALLRIWKIDLIQDSPSANNILCAVATVALLNAYPDESASKLRHDAQQKLATAAQELAKLTNDKGLHYSAAALASTTAHCDLLLNAFALYIMRRLRLADVHMPRALEMLEATWRIALEQGLQTYANRMLQQEPHMFVDFDVLAAALLALGSQWQPRNSVRLRQKKFQKLQSALSLERLLEAVDSLSSFSKAAVGLLLLLPGMPAEDKRAALTKSSLIDMPRNIRSIFEYLASSLRVTARTAYVAESPGSQHAASINANGMALSALAMAEHLTAQTLYFTTGVEKLANHVAQGAGSLACAGSVSLLHMALGLVDYDMASGNTKADLDFVALAGYAPLLTLRVDPTADKTPSFFEMPWDKLPTPPPPLLFKAEGVGEVSVAVTLRFVPPVQKRFLAPVYRGIDVQKIVQLYDSVLGVPHGPALAAVPLGHVVTVTLQVTTVDDLQGVSVEDWLPAGLEALDPNLVGDHASASEAIAGCFWYFCPVFNRETKKDRVTFYSSWLYAGTHTLRYQAVAATLGTFVLPPGRASVTLEPEVMGLSSGGQFHVLPYTEKPQSMMSSTDGSNDGNSPGLPAPKPCPHNCMGQGECDTTSGKCQCNPGSSGIDCSDEAHVPVMQPFTDASGQILDVLKLVAGSKEVELLVELVAQGFQKTMLPTWLFASSTDLSGAGGDGAGDIKHSDHVGRHARILIAPEPLNLQVLPSKRRVVLRPPEEVARALTANLTVSASTDGRFFASRQLSVRLYPDCIPGSSSSCACDHQVSAATDEMQKKPSTVKGIAEAGGKMHCDAAGIYGACSCWDRSPIAPVGAPAENTIERAPESQPDDGESPWPLYVLLVLLCALLARPCHQVCWRRIYCRFAQPEENAPLFGRADGRETELAQRGDDVMSSSSATSLLRSRGSPSAVDASYWNVADLGE